MAEDPTPLPEAQGSTMGMTIQQRDTIENVERAGAVVSMLSICLIIAAYGLFKRVRTLPNTFILCASIANLGASIACLIGYAGIIAGLDSALCQTQAFMLEMFMQSDPWWSFAMAVNVYMVFFMGYPTVNFRRHIWIYCVLCFGIPAIPAFICLLYAPNGKRIYGNATLWCWIDDDYNQLRILTYYLPIWFCIFMSAIIYIAVGYRVFHRRNQLKHLTMSNPVPESSTEHPSSVEKRGQPYGMVTTEVRVTTAECASNPSPPSTPSGSIEPVLQKPGPNTHLHDPWSTPDDDADLMVGTSQHHHFPQHHYTITSTISSAGPTSFSHPNSAQSNLRRPTGQFRGTQPLSPTSPLPSSPSQLETESNFFAPVVRSWRHFRSKLANLDPIKLSYLRTSFLFAISILVTWTPSSINRMHSVIHPHLPISYALNLAASVVLPLQGLWNAIIMFATTWTTLKEEISDLMAKLTGRKTRRDSEKKPQVDVALPGMAVPRRPSRPLDGGLDLEVGPNNDDIDDQPLPAMSSALTQTDSRRSSTRELPPLSRSATSMRNIRVIKSSDL